MHHIFCAKSHCLCLTLSPLSLSKLTNMDNNGGNEINSISSPEFMFEFDDTNSDIWDFEFPNEVENDLEFSFMFDDNHALEFDHHFQTTHVNNAVGSSSLQPLENFTSAQPSSLQIMENSSVHGELMKENAIRTGGPSTDVNNNVTRGRTGCGGKRKRKSNPAKNVLYERKRREKLNAGLLALRSVVPNITKMDRTSTLGDAIEHIKDLLEKINKLKLELESAPLRPPVVAPAAPLMLPVNAPVMPPVTAPFMPLVAAPTPTIVLSSIGEEISPNPVRIEVRQSERGVVIIHMRSRWRPGLLHLITKTLNDLGLELEDAVISHFNGFKLDIYRAQQSRDVHEDQIRAMLFETVGYHSAV